MANPLNLPMVGRTLRNLVSRPVTRRYPAEARAPFPGARGTLEFDVDTCIFCMLCARKCPTGAITCLRDERYFAIEQLSCIACGVCVDVCSKHSLWLTGERRAVHVAAERGPDGERPGHEEWHGVIPEPKPESNAGAGPEPAAAPAAAVAARPEPAAAPAGLEPAAVASKPELAAAPSNQKRGAAAAAPPPPTAEP
jgi:ech hydrogenase subunit F